MALQHRRTVAVELVLERGNHSGMIVADVVNAVAGNEIQDAPPAGGVELGANAARVIDVHPQNIKQPYPLRIHVFFVQHFVIHNALCFWHRTYPQALGRAHFCPADASASHGDITSWRGAGGRE